jgi:hypothetical protein
VGGKYAQTVTDHILGHVNGHMSASIMYGNGVANHLGEDGAGATPGPDDFLFTALVHGFNFLE